MWGRGLLSAVLAKPRPRRPERAKVPRETPREAPSAAAPALSGATELAHVLPGKTCAGCPSPLLRPVILWKTLPAGKAKHLNFFFSLTSRAPRGLLTEPHARVLSDAIGLSHVFSGKTCSQLPQSAAGRSRLAEDAAG